MDYSKNITHISLCAGYGGIDLGLQRAIPAVRTIAFCEIETYACANLVTKMEAGLLDSAPIWTDLKTFPWSSFSGKVDIISGGFPCQPFSAAGSRGADEDPRHLFPHILRGLTELGLPPIVFLENVEGIISAKLVGTQWTDPPGTSVLQHVLRELERVGYRATAGVFSASEVGAPHQRKRVFILGLRDDISSKGYAFISSFIRNKRISKLADTNNSRDSSSTSDTYGNWEESKRKRYKQSQFESSRHCYSARDAWPAGRGYFYHGWEPPRITNQFVPTQHKCPDAKFICSQAIEFEMGRNLNGDSHRLDYGNLCRSVDSYDDELRLLGNGVVPAVAERAFRILWERLSNQTPIRINND